MAFDPSIRGSSSLEQSLVRSLFSLLTGQLAAEFLERLPLASIPCSNLAPI